MVLYLYGYCNQLELIQIKLVFDINYNIIDTGNLFKEISKSMAKKKTSQKKTSYGASRGHLSDFDINAKRAKKNTKKSTSKKVTKKKFPSKNISKNREKGFASGKRPYDYAFYEKEEATIDYMQRLFDEREFDVSGKELDQFWKYYLLLRKMNAELDLTRIMGIEATVLKHFIDCAIVADIHELRGSLLDIGSGPGFPGAPIAIRRPDMPVILAESRGKRVRFLEMLKKELGLNNVTIYPKSVREDSPLQATTIVTRAVEIIPATLKRVQPFIADGGEVVFMKGPSCGQEITDAQQGFKGIYKMTADYKYDLPNTSQNRRLVVFTKRESKDQDK